MTEWICGAFRLLSVFFGWWMLLGSCKMCVTILGSGVACSCVACIRPFLKSHWYKVAIDSMAFEGYMLIFNKSLWSTIIQFAWRSFDSYRCLTLAITAYCDWLILEVWAHTVTALFQFLPSQGSAACHRCDTRVSPDGGRSPPANQVDSLDTLGLPPRPLPYDDSQSSPRMVQHPLVSGHDKAPTHVQKLGQPAETKNTHTGSTCTAHKVSASSPKQHSEGSRMDDGVQFCDSSDSEDDCPVCLEGWWKQLTLLLFRNCLFFRHVYTGFLSYRFKCLACMNKKINS